MEMLVYVISIRRAGLRCPTAELSVGSLNVILRSIESQSYIGFPGNVLNVVSAERPMTIECATGRRASEPKRIWSSSCTLGDPTKVETRDFSTWSPFWLARRTSSWRRRIARRSHYSKIRVGNNDEQVLKMIVAL